MFIVKPPTKVDLAEALSLLSNYAVSCTTYNSNGLTTEGIELVVDSESEYGALHLCEMAFQMNFRQKGGKLCPRCIAEIERTGEGDSICGHLVFTSFI